MCRFFELWDLNYQWCSLCLCKTTGLSCSERLPCSCFQVKLHATVFPNRCVLTELSEYSVFQHHMFHFWDLFFFAGKDFWDKCRDFQNAVPVAAEGNLTLVYRTEGGFTIPFISHCLHAVFSYERSMRNKYLKQWRDVERGEGSPLPFRLTGSRIKGLQLDCSHLSFPCIYGIMSNGTFTLFSSLDYFGPLSSSHTPFYSNDILSHMSRTTLTKSDANCKGLTGNTRPAVLEMLSQSTGISQCRLPLHSSCCC